MTNVLLATSNGTGMGHLTRQAAIGLKLAGEHQPVLFSLSIGLPQATSLGLRGEYTPSYDRPWIAPRAWNSYLRDRLVAIVEETNSKVVLFDGVAPYPGIGHASSIKRDVAFVWLRRGMWRKGTGRKQLRRAHYFETAIEPGDLAGDADKGPTTDMINVTRIAPISLVEVLEPLSRDDARLALGLPEDREIALITLGSGLLGDVAGPGTAALETILESSDVHVAVTRSAVAQQEVPAVVADRLTVIRDVYPLVPYLSAFDLAISSAGYNAVHELIPAAIPTLFVANSSTRTDDQVTRSRRLAELGLALSAVDTDQAAIATETVRLLDRAVRAELAGRAAATRAEMRGATQAARFIVELAAVFTRRRPPLSVAISEQTQKVKDLVKDVLGEERTNAIKGLLGREPSSIGDRMRVRLVDNPTESTGGVIPLLITSDVTADLLRGPIPVEHILPAASDAYGDRRLEMIRTYYDVVD